MTQQLKGFNSYEDYLDSQLVEEDLYYLKVIINHHLSHLHLSPDILLINNKCCERFLKYFSLRMLSLPG